MEEVEKISEIDKQTHREELKKQIEDLIFPYGNKVKAYSNSMRWINCDCYELIKYLYDLEKTLTVEYINKEGKPCTCFIRWNKGYPYIEESCIGD